MDHEDINLLQNYGHYSNFQTPILAAEDRPPFFCDTQCRDMEKVYLDPGVNSFFHEAYLRTLGSSGPSDSQSAGEASLPPSSLPPLLEMDDNYMMSAFQSAFDPQRNATHLDNQTAIDPYRTWQNPLLPLVGGTLHHIPDPSIAAFTFSPHMMPPFPPLEPSISLHASPYQTLGSPSLHSRSQTKIRETGSRRHASHYAAFHKSIRSSRRRHVARAIQYDELWIDEEELRKGLTKPGAKLIVHQCHWEEGLSPCHLRITADKSYISKHLQKWHGMQPGGDKLQVDCRWSTCGKTMLKESLSRHILTVHLGEMWECLGCGKEVARNDAYGRHAMKSDFDACRTSGALVSHIPGGREIDARAALEYERMML